MTLIAHLATLLIRRAERRMPNFVVETPRAIYLRRWWLLPRNLFFNIYLHHFVSSDDDRALHDHPWVSLSLTLRGVVSEVLPCRQRQMPALDYHPKCIRTRIHRAGSLVWRRARMRHRIEVRGDGAWTLFITGPVIRDWGFHCTHGWVRHSDFLADNGDGGTVGVMAPSRPPRRLRDVWSARNA